MRWLLWLVLLTGCGHVCVDEEFYLLQERVGEHTGYAVDWLESPDGVALAQDSMSLDDAICVALHCNPTLAIRLEDLGVAKADLVQAGLFTNPQLSLDWRLPSGRSSIESSLLFALTDLWQRPIRKQRAALAAEETAQQVVDVVLNTVALVRHAFVHYLYAQEALALNECLLEEDIRLRDRIAYRQGFGLESDWQVDLADAMVGIETVNVAHSRLDLQQEQVQFRAALGLAAECCTPAVKGKLALPTLPRGDEQALVNLALKVRPDLLALQTGVHRAEESVRLQKSRFIRQLNFGVAQEKEPGSPNGFGPGLAVQLPLFDQNVAQIARARFLVRQAQGRVREGEVHAAAQVMEAIQNLRGSIEQIELMRRRVLPPLDRAWAYAERYGRTMQVNLLFLIEARRRLVEARQQELALLRDAQLAFIDLERAVAMPLQ